MQQPSQEKEYLQHDPRVQKYTVNGTTGHAEEKYNGPVESDIDRVHDEPEIQLIPEHVLKMDMTKPLPPGITVVSNGFRYKGKPWPGKGDICLKCRGQMCESLLLPFLSIPMSLSRSRS